MSKEKRTCIWKHVLNVKYNILDYHALRHKISQNTEFIWNVDDVISLDVQRSYTNIDNRI